MSAESQQSRPVLPDGNGALPLERPIHSGSKQTPSQSLRKLQQSPLLHWRPPYLRRRVLAIFCGIFIALVIALSVLLSVSNNNTGLATGYQGDHYLWTYGPTAILTVIAALFNRVEYQSKMFAPWESLSRQHPAKGVDSVVLDYNSRLQPVAIDHAIRKRHFTVAIATTVSLLIKLLIVLSTGLITLLPMEVIDHSYSMILENEFGHSKTSSLGFGPAGNVTSPLYIMQSLQGYTGDRLEFVTGLFKNFAFPSLSTNLPAAAKFGATVDGLETWLDCNPANLTLPDFGGDERDFPAIYQYAPRTDITLTSSDCQMTLSLRDPPWDDAPGPDQRRFSRFVEQQCDGTTGDAGKRMALVTGVLDYFINETAPISSDCDSWSTCENNQTYQDAIRTRGRLLQSAQLLCKPGYRITKINVVGNGTSTLSLEPAIGFPNVTLVKVSAWDIATAHFRSYAAAADSAPSKEVRTNDGKTVVDYDVYSKGIIASLQTSDTEVDWVYDQGHIQELLDAYYRQFGAIIGQQMLLEPASIPMIGSATLVKNRLVVQQWPAELMIGVVVVSLLLTLLAILTVPRHGVLPQSPNTLLGTAVIVSHSPSLLAMLRHFGDVASHSLGKTLHQAVFHTRIIDNLADNEKVFAMIWNKPVRVGSTNMPRKIGQEKSDQKYPRILHLLPRLGLFLILLAFTVALEMTLRKSNVNNGLGSAGENSSIHYLWTAMPTIIFGGLAMVFSSMDFNTRTIAMYWKLSKTVTTEIFVELDFLDVSILRAMYREARSRTFGALAMTTLMLFASLYTIFAGSLFQAVPYPMTFSTSLQVNGSMSTNSSLYTAADDEFLQDVGNTVSLIMSANLSFPQFTYKDLTFPQFMPAMLPTTNSIFDASTVPITAVIPAVRPAFDCRLYGRADIQSKVIMNYTAEASSDKDAEGNLIPSNPLELMIQDEQCNYFYRDPKQVGDLFKWNFTLVIWDATNVTYFGGGFTDDTKCSELLYIWGHLGHSEDGNITVQHVAALGCNQTLEVVDVDVHFTGAALEIDSKNPPNPRDESRRKTAVKVDTAGLYDYLPGSPLDNDIYLNHFFSPLIYSPWAIPLQMLGNASNDKDVQDAALSQQGILVSQMLNKQRVYGNTTDMMPGLSSEVQGANDARSYNASGIDATSSRRVVQDPVSTHVLEALLIASALLLIVAWALEPRTDIVPRDPRSIASMAAVIAGGNLLDLIPADAQRLSDKDLKDALRPDTKFWLGRGVAPGGKPLLQEDSDGMDRFGLYAR